MNILVTGGAGFIGSNLCQKLYSLGHELTIIDCLLPQVHGQNPEVESESYIKTKNLGEFIIGNVEDISSYPKNKNYDVIVCLAAETGTGQSMMSSKKHCDSNIGSICVLNDLIVNGDISCKKIILSSSRSVYGDADLDTYGNPIPTKETDRIDPKSIYAITKYTQEQILLKGFENISKCILRFQNVYGPGQSLKNPYTGIISIFSTAIKNNKDIQVFDDGKMSRDFVYIDDVVDSIILSIENETINNEILNVGSGISTTVYQVADKLKEKFKSKINIKITGEKLVGDIRHNLADISKIKEFGFQPKVTFEKGIENFIKWVINKDIDDNDYEKSLNNFRKTGLLKK